MRSFKLQSIILSLFLIITLSGCYSTRHIRIEVLKPSEIYYVAPIGKTVIDTVNMKKKIQVDSLHNIDTLLISYLNSFKNELFELGCCDSIIYQNAMKNNSSGAELIINLELFQIITKTNFKTVFPETLNNNDTTIKEEYRGTYEIDYNIQWSVYNKNYEKLYKGKTTNNDLSWKYASTIEKRVKEKISELQAETVSIIASTGKAQASVFSPEWKYVERRYFTNNSKDFSLAEYYAGVNEWINAAEVWSEYANSGINSKAKYATYNMALASEMEGNLEAAIYWARLSSEKYLNPKAGKYLKILQNRYKEQEILANQMKK